MPRNELCAGCGHSKPTEKLRHLLDATEGRHPEWNIAYDISTPAKICKYCYTDRLLKRASVDDQRQTRAAAAAAAPLKPVRPYAREPDTGEHSAPPSIAKRERPEDEGKDEDAEKRARAEELGDSGAVGGGNEGGEETSEVESTNESEDETLEELAPFPEVPAARAMEDAVRSELDERGKIATYFPLPLQLFLLRTSICLCYYFPETTLCRLCAQAGTAARPRPAERLPQRDSGAYRGGCRVASAGCAKPLDRHEARSGRRTSAPPSSRGICAKRKLSPCKKPRPHL